MTLIGNPRADECKIVGFRIPSPGEYFLAEADDHNALNPRRGGGWVYRAVPASEPVAKQEPRYIVEKIEPPAIGTCEIKVDIDTSAAREQAEAFAKEVEERFKEAYEGGTPPPCCVHFDEEPIADAPRLEFVSSVLSTPPAPPAHITNITLNIDPRTPAAVVRELGFALEAIA